MKLPTRLLLMSLFLLPVPVQAQNEDPFAELRAMSGDGAPEVAAPALPQSSVVNNEVLQGTLADAQMSAEERQELIEQQARDIAFDAALNGLLPMRPDEIRLLLRKYDESTTAAQEPIDPAPTPEVTVETVSLDPGVVPPTIKVAPGHVTTVTTLDITGEPWPIQDVSWGGDFDVIQPEEGGHVLRISPLGAFKRGNMSLRLVDLKTPVTFMLQAGKDVVQYRFDAQIPEYGPNARPSIIESGGIRAVAGNTTLMAVLDGVIPSGAQRLAINGVDGRTSAYKLNGSIYLRTPYTLLSPAWSNSVNSVDGLRVYTIDDTPVVLLSDNGKMIRASFSEKGNL